MTDRHAGYVITLAHDLRDDDSQKIIEALKMVKGVISVDPVISDVSLLIAQAKADNRWTQRILEMLAQPGSSNG